MGQPGWTSTTAGAEGDVPDEAREALEKLGIDPSKAKVDVEQSSQTIDLRGSGHRDQAEKVLREYGIDPDKEGQTIDASKVPGLPEALLKVLMGAGLKIPNAGGFGGGISAPKQDPLAQIEHLAKKRDSGEITDAEFEAQKKRLLGP